MTEYTGTVKNGMVILDGDDSPEEGTRVKVLPVSPEPKEDRSAPTVYERYKDFIGSVNNLPEDLAEQHDHYLYGTPKQ